MFAAVRVKHQRSHLPAWIGYARELLRGVTQLGVASWLENSVYMVEEKWRIIDSPA